MVNLKVVKKDGKVEDFDKKRIYEACKAAGASDEVAEEVTEKVIKEIHKVASSTIRELQLKYLEKLDPEASKKMIQFDIRKKKEVSEEAVNYNVL
jgi:transcriptional regulator NrdR family protein